MLKSRSDFMRIWFPPINLWSAPDYRNYGDQSLNRHPELFFEPVQEISNRRDDPEKRESYPYLV